MKQIVTREDLNDLVAEHGTISAAARALGWPRSTFWDRLNAAESTEYKITDEAGNVISRQWVKYPAGKTSDVEREQQLVEAVQRILDEAAPLPRLRTPAAATQIEDLITVYIITDLHLLMLSWLPETGENWDLKIAERALMETLTDVVAASPPSEHAVVLNVGDFFHTDDDSSRTRLHGNMLDTDSRYDKALNLGADMIVWATELALQKHKYVEVAAVPGNHDEYAMKALRLAMRFAFLNNPRVTVNYNPSVFWFRQFGKTMLCAHHGHKVKGPQMPGVMASTMPYMWGTTTHRYAFMGHLHKSMLGGDEQHGAKWEVFQTLAAKDEWSYSNGYRSGRSLTSLTFHKAGGEFCRTTRQVRI